MQRLQKQQSSKKHSLPETDNESSERRVRPRHFHKAAPCAVSGNSSSMHVDVLGVVFGFCDLKELFWMTQVCTLWKHAAYKMSSIRTSLRPSFMRDTPKLLHMIASPLFKHVRCLDLHDFQKANYMLPHAAYTMLMSGVPSIYIQMHLPVNVQQLQVGCKLRILHLDISSGAGEMSIPESLNQIMSRISEHAPQLEALHLLAGIHALDGVDFSPLSKLKHLAHFSIDQHQECTYRHWHLSVQQWKDLAAIPSLVDLATTILTPNSVLNLIQADTFPSLESLRFTNEMDDSTSFWICLNKFPQLCELNVSIWMRPGVHVIFPARLTTVDINLVFVSRDEKKAILRSLSACSGLVRLDVYEDYEDLPGVLACFPKLRELCLCNCTISSLNFLNACPATLNSLSILSVYDHLLPLSEARHLYRFHDLVQLTLNQVFKNWETRDELTDTIFQPHSTLFPHLSSFSSEL